MARGLPPAADLDPFGVPDEMQDAFDMQEDIVRDVSRHSAGTAPCCSVQGCQPGVGSVHHVGQHLQGEWTAKLLRQGHPELVVSHQAMIAQNGRFLGFERLCNPLKHQSFGLGAYVTVVPTDPWFEWVTANTARHCRSSARSRG